MRRICGFFILGLLLAVTPAQAKNASPQEQAKAVKAKLAESKAEHAKLVAKSKALESEMSDLKTKLVSASAAVRDTEAKIATSTQKLKALRVQKAQYVAAFYKEQEHLGGMVTAAQRFRRTEAPQLFLQTSPIDAARASLVMKSTIPLLHAQSAATQAHLGDIAKVEAQINQQMADQSAAYKKVTAQEKDMSKLLEQRQDIYKKTENDRAAQEKEMADLAAQAKNLDDLILKIGRAKKGAPVAKREPLPSNVISPVSGAILSGFGDPDDLGQPSKGVTFDARSGATVVTPLAGKVKFAGPFQKYRQILIIEHRGGYHSLIAGLGRIDTVVGADLRAGEPVGKAATGDNPQPVYYEFRQNGDPVDPRKILLAQRNQPNKG